MNSSQEKIAARLLVVLNDRVLQMRWLRKFLLWWLRGGFFNCGWLGGVAKQTFKCRTKYTFSYQRIRILAGFRKECEAKQKPDPRSSPTSHIIKISENPAESKIKVEG